MASGDEFAGGLNCDLQSTLLSANDFLLADDILNHTNNKAKDVTEPRHKISDGRSPLDALFSLTTSFESMKQKSGREEREELPR